MIPAQDGRPADCRFVDVNAAFERQTGLRDAIGKTAREMIPGHDEHWYERYERIARTGQAERFEAQAEALGRCYEVYAFAVEPQAKLRVATLVRAIGERRQAE